ncbi:MAG: PLP-dependent transferase [Tannerellaceae bacterium]|nr:PLP-dependent transferase [Tannerellaceae bacterium]
MVGGRSTIPLRPKATISGIYQAGLLYGPTLSPFDGWLLVRSLRTLELRVEQHSENARQLAEWLSQNEKLPGNF